uniref:Uncharacterized protein n=1 Tax=Vespula pensylvanica TaxID=30213 RepID=A0A834P868_VESPE|nr:hypothetical protein H0235_004349 [Vespula pensylvanica]
MLMEEVEMVIEGRGRESRETTGVVVIILFCDLYRDAWAIEAANLRRQRTANRDWQFSQRGNSPTLQKPCAVSSAQTRVRWTKQDAGMPRG